MYGPKRNHVLFLFDGFLKNFGFAILALILLLSGKASDSIRELLIVIAVSPIVRLIDYFTTTFEINETYLIIRKGLFTKKKTEIPLATITTVDLTQDLLFQLFKVYKIKIDNTTQAKDAANKAEAELVLKKEDAFYVKQLLVSHSQANQQEVSEAAPQESVTINSGDFMLLGLLQSKLGYIFSVLSVLFVVIPIISSGSTEDEAIEHFFNMLATRINSFASFVTVFLILYLFALAFSLLSTSLKYYKFMLSKKGEYLNIEYGLFHKKKYSLSMEKINGVRLTQNLLMRIFKYYMVEVFVIGYGDDKEEGEQETAMLIPIAKRDRVETLLAKLLPDFELPKSLSKPQKRALPYFFLSFAFIFTLLIVVISLFTHNAVFITFASAFFLLEAVGEILEYKSEGMSVNKKNVAAVNGKYTCCTTIIKTSSIESVSCTASIRKRRKGICHISFGFWGPKSVANTKIRNMNISDYEALKNVIEV